MLYDPSLIGNAGTELFDPQYWRSRGPVARPAGGRGDALFVGADGGNWVLRHYRRGGWMARMSKDRYLWTGEERTRPFREWRLLAGLYREGLPVPRPVAARYLRRGLTYSGDLLTERIADARPLASFLQSSQSSPEIWEAVGRCVRRFHDVGVCHADLNVHNILIVPNGAVFLIDFDRGRRRRPGKWMQENLRRLRRSMNKINHGLLAPDTAERDWAALLRGYARTV